MEWVVEYRGHEQRRQGLLCPSLSIGPLVIPGVDLACWRSKRNLLRLMGRRLGRIQRRVKPRCGSLLRFYSGQSRWVSRRTIELIMHLIAQAFFG
jgi:hypothetical protein